jgi:hypothetical protein
VCVAPKLSVTAVHRQSDDSVWLLFVTCRFAAAVSKDNPRLIKEAMGSSQNLGTYRIRVRSIVSAMPMSRIRASS